MFIFWVLELKRVVCVYFVLKEKKVLKVWRENKVIKDVEENEFGIVIKLMTGYYNMNLITLVSYSQSVVK